VKRLADLVAGTGADVLGDAQTMITGVAGHSGKIAPGGLFVAVEGFKTSGRNYVVDAVGRGAAAVATRDVSDRSDRADSGFPVLIRVDNPRRFLAQAVNRFYDFPARSVKLIGVVGTNGKTTTTYLIKAILEAAGERSGLVGTIRHYDGEQWIPAANTTPESPDLVRMLAKLRDRKIGYCVMEVSSHAIALERVADLEFAVGVFTNFTQDHLDFHGSMEEYKQVKLRFFRELKPEAWAVYNADDSAGAEFRGATRAQKVSYGMLSGDRLSVSRPCGDSGIVRAEITSLSDRATGFKLMVDGDGIDLTTTLIGRHNVYNIMAAAGVARCLGIDLPVVQQGIRQVKVLPGRMKRVENPQGLSVFIDYAHSPDALEHLIRAAREIQEAPVSGSDTGSRHRVIVVFGCGGNRDKEKRPIMGRVATELADYVILTSDNPRDEDPIAIIDDIKTGIKKDTYEVEPDRYRAIGRALSLATNADIVLIAGKGHEDYQIVGRERRHFDDEETVTALLGAQ
jgi:UDP-N-acetylmuramoyl-L-alanyl-D-glutamate--2,6-diaminopimelate ligase